ncbi:MAG: transcription antitermination factor NusB [Chloroflexota bacterium]|nr:transcription antitermination factor NusB [Chloroflexota bacterium]
MKIRRGARIAVFQTLFEVDLVNHAASASLQQRLKDAPLPPSGVNFAKYLLAGVLRYQKAFDAIIQRIAPEWPIDQIAVVDRNVLRLAAFEILVDDDVPPKVAINEAVELAKMFGSESSSRFVNGVLGTLFANKDEFSASLDLLMEADAVSSDKPVECGV